MKNKGLYKKKYKVLYSVWDEIIAFLPKEYKNLIFTISYNNLPDYELLKGGMAEPFNIILGADFVEKFKNDKYALLHMLTHEVAHYILGHMVPNSFTGAKEQEQDCDNLGLFISMKLGYDTKKYLKSTELYEKWRQKGIQKSHIKSHGTAKERVEKLQSQVKYLYHLDSNKLVLRRFCAYTERNVVKRG